MNASEPTSDQIPARNLLAPGAQGEAETQRVLGVCNACRYCEAMCPVFSTLTQYRAPKLAQMDYLANLCHNCGACFDVCQYAQPHPFALDVPTALAEQRLQSYERFAWPSLFARGLRAQPSLMVVGLLVGLTLLLLGFGLANGPSGLWGDYSAQGSFYAVMPHAVMAGLGGISFGFAALALSVSTFRFARHLELDGVALGRWQVWSEALGAAATLRYLGDDQGCQTLSASQGAKRRFWHHVMAYGFGLCFLSTCVATFYHYGLGLVAPYGLTSLPVALGAVGGIGLMVGPLVLVLLKRHARPTSDLNSSSIQLDASFLLLLAWVSATGLGLLLLRDHPSMPLVLAVHLGAVFCLFLLLPYSKFVHAPFRLLALAKHAAQDR